jgi:hypothetical protein
MLCHESTATHPDSPVAVSMQAHSDLFQGLAHDDQLRENLVAHPIETLAAYGIHLDRQLAPADVTLPEKAEFDGAAVIWEGFF